MSVLNNQVIAITGAGRGIGKTLAEECKRNGAKVAICARSEKDLEIALKDLKKINDIPCYAAVCDVTKKTDTQKFFENTTRTLGSLNGLICSAGVYGAIGSFLDTEFSEWQAAIDINLTGTALSIHTAYNYFDHSKPGKIILFSGGGQGPLPNFSGYATSKGGVWRLTETLGAELASKNIFMNAIAPGAVNTKLLDDLLQAGPEKVGQEFYQKSLAQKEQGGTSPQKSAELVLYLLSEKSNGLYGKTLSALWDPYKDFKDLEKMSQSDIYQVRRVVESDGGTRPKK
jgi:NAD(P)-dependent dehydrogenase (short-subunit alcohol dehydrogenase family)